MADESDELWHVRVSADEVKILTLEQVDDLFRLEVIDADTQLWQPGMDEWLPLRVVAGLDDEEVVNVSVPPTAPPPAALSATGTSWPPSVSGAASSFPPPSLRSAPPPPSSRAPAPPSSRAPAIATTNSSWPPVVTSSRPPFAMNPFAETLPQSAAPLSARPLPAAPAVPSSVPLVADPPPYMNPRPRVAVLPIALAAAAGLIVTLHRNDVLHAAARTVGQEAAYLKLESALGGPGFGTPRAVEEMAKAAATLPTLDLVERQVTKTDDSDEAGDSSTSSAPLAKASKPKAEKAAPAARAPAAPRPASRAPAASPAHHPTFNAPKKAQKAKGNEYDPLNPSL